MVFYHGSLVDLKVGASLMPSMRYAELNYHVPPLEPRVYFTPFLHFAMAFALREISTPPHRAQIAFPEPVSGISPVTLVCAESMPNSHDEMERMMYGQSYWVPWKKWDASAYVYEIEPTGNIYDEGGKIRKSDWHKLEEFHLKNTPAIITKKHKITVVDFLSHPANNCVNVRCFSGDETGQSIIIENIDITDAASARAFWLMQQQRQYE